MIDPKLEITVMAAPVLKEDFENVYLDWLNFEIVIIFINILTIARFQNMYKLIIKWEQYLIFLYKSIELGLNGVGKRKQREWFWHQVFLTSERNYVE